MYLFINHHSVEWIFNACLVCVNYYLRNSNKYEQILSSFYGMYIYWSLIWCIILWFGVTAMDKYPWKSQYTVNLGSLVLQSYQPRAKLGEWPKHLHFHVCSFKASRSKLTCSSKSAFFCWPFSTIPTLRHLLNISPYLLNTQFCIFYAESHFIVIFLYLTSFHPCWKVGK